MSEQHISNLDPCDATTAASPVPPATIPEKHGRIEGGILTDEALASSPGVLRRARGGSSFTGLQQWFAPPEAARLIACVLEGAEGVLDPTAGAGGLLSCFPEDRRYGIEIDRDHANNAPYHAIAGDAQKVVPMLRAAGMTFPAIALNPPFGLTWQDPAHAKGRINSTALAYLWALDLISLFGQGAMITGTERLAREILPREAGRGVYAIVDVDGPLFDGVDLATSIAFFVKPDNRTIDEVARFSADRAGLPETAGLVVAARGRLARRVSPHALTPRRDLAKDFAAVGKERRRRIAARNKDSGAATRFDLSLKNGKVSSHPSAYAKLALAKKKQLREVELLNGQHPGYFGQNTRSFRQLEALADEGHVTLDPALREAARKAIEDASRFSTPLFPVPIQMRLGWLTDLDRIRCTSGDPERGYEEGEHYRLSTRSKVVSENSQRIVENKHGDGELRKFVTERKLLEVRIGGCSFDEGAESIEYISGHFDLPDPGCVATRFPEEVARNRRVLGELELEIRKNHEAYMKAAGNEGFEQFSFKSFQTDHLSRLLVKRRGMLAHEQGLGKTLQLMCLAEASAHLGAKDQALFVIPQDLTPQWQAEAEKFFGRAMEVIRTPAQARDVARRVKAGESGWWLTYYEALSVVGRKKEVLPEKPLDPKDALHERLAAYKRKKKGLPPAEGGDPFSGPAATKFACPQCRADTQDGWDGEVCSSCGCTMRSVYVKSAYSHLTTAFKKGVKCVDEVSEMRGDDSLRSKAIRAISRGPHNYGATGTPLSNFIADSFWGLWFALGNASTAFPYDYTSGKSKFEMDFCVIENLMGRRKDGEEHLRKRRKVLPQITNVSQFWRLAQPGISRCRKEQTGEPLVERTYHPVRVPMGVQQRKSHGFWLENFAEYFTWKDPQHALVKEGLVEKFAAALGQLWRLETAATLPASDEPSKDWPVARAELAGLSNYTPANLKVLELALEHVEKGEKVLIGSDLIAPGKWIADRLREKGVRSVHITEERSGRLGTKNPRKRASAVEAFAKGDAQVLCAGVGAMKLGHNLDVASTVIVSGLPYSYMALSQFEARVHRLTSTRPVSVYVVIPKGSLAERKWGLLADKGGASDLAYDGELSVQPEKPVDWSRVLKDMVARGIRALGDEIPEDEVEAAWKSVPVLVSPAPTRLASPSPAPTRAKPPPLSTRSLFDLLEEDGGAPRADPGPARQLALFDSGDGGSDDATDAA